MLNVYSENDYILAFLYRATSILFGVAGLQEISDVEGVDNLNLSKEVSGHLRHPSLIGKILKRAGFAGIKVEDTSIEAEQLGEIGLIDVEVDADAAVMSEHGLENLIDLDDERAEMDAGSVIPSNQSTIGQPPTYREAHMVPVARQRPTVERQTTELGGTTEVVSAISQLRVRDGDNEGSNAGIQMIDNDEGDLMQLPSERIPDDQTEVHQPQSGSSFIGTSEMPEN